MAKPSKPYELNYGKPISRKEAKAAGLSRYFTGKPCPKGHIATRTVSRASCTECRALWRAENQDKIREYRYAYYRKNPKKHLGPGHNAGCLRRYHERKSDLQFRITYQLRARTRHALRGLTTSRTAIELLGCTASECIAHIESLWYRPDMSWETWGQGHGHWQIDHIRPLVSFDLSDPEQRAAAFHYTNLQPLWFDDHRRKTNAEHPRARKLGKDNRAHINVGRIKRHPPDRTRWGSE